MTNLNEAEVAGAVKPLDWRKPTEFDREQLGHEGATWIAPGLGGHYAIQNDLDNVILWQIEDPFAFDTYPSEAETKAAAEAHWQKTMAGKAVITSAELIANTDCARGAVRVPGETGDRRIYGQPEAPPAGPAEGGDASLRPHPRWNPKKPGERHPQTVEGWDWRTRRTIDDCLARLAVAEDYADPRAPDQMALVNRLDLMRVHGDYVRLRALADIYRQKLDTPSTGEAVAPVAWLRDAHEGEGDECLVPAAKGDPGAFAVFAHPPKPLPSEAEIARVIERLTVLRDHARNGTAVSDPNEWEADELDEIIAMIRGEGA